VLGPQDTLLKRRAVGQRDIAEIEPVMCARKELRNALGQRLQSRRDTRRGCNPGIAQDGAHRPSRARQDHPPGAAAAIRLIE
jgi:hypothetical protein